MYILILSSFVISVLSVANPLTVDLGGCAAYEGTDLGNGVNQWFGIPFAAPPTGNLRFRAPQPLVCDGEIHNATTVRLHSSMSSFLEPFSDLT